MQKASFIKNNKSEQSLQPTQQNLDTIRRGAGTFFLCPLNGNRISQHVFMVKGRITASRASASAQSSSEADCHWEVTATKSKQSFVHESWVLTQLWCNIMGH